MAVDRSRWQAHALGPLGSRIFPTDEGRFDRGLQALEFSLLLKTAAVVGQDERFVKAYQEFVSLGYPAYTLRQRQVFPPENVAAL